MEACTSTRLASRSGPLLAGLVLATGIGGGRRRPPRPRPPTAPVAATQLVDAPGTGVTLSQTIDAADGG